MVPLMAMTVDGDVIPFGYAYRSDCAQIVSRRYAGIERVWAA